MANKVTSKEIPEGKDQFVYLDVREANELEEGKIDAAVNIPEKLPHTLIFLPGSIESH